MVEYFFFTPIYGMILTMIWCKNLFPYYYHNTVEGTVIISMKPKQFILISKLNGPNSQRRFVDKPRFVDRPSFVSPNLLLFSTNQVCKKRVKRVIWRTKTKVCRQTSFVNSGQ